MFKSHIKSTVENFYICTHMPVKAFKFDASLICEVGFDERLNKFFTSKKVLDSLIKEFLKDYKKAMVTINCKDNITFTACKICPCNSNEGFYVIGPYSDETTGLPGVVHKPHFCIPHLVSLLRSIEKDISFIKITGPYPKPVYSFHIKKALDYINNNFHNPITLDRISNLLKINKSYLCGVLKKETGKTFSQLLNELRIEKSKDLLSDPNISIFEIAMSVGFNNQNYFNKIFKKLTDKTPLEYRNSITSIDI